MEWVSKTPVSVIIRRGWQQVLPMYIISVQSSLWQKLAWSPVCSGPLRYDHIVNSFRIRTSIYAWLTKILISLQRPTQKTRQGHTHTQKYLTIPRRCESQLNNGGPRSGPTRHTASTSTQTRGKHNQHQLYPQP